MATTILEMRTSFQTNQNKKEMKHFFFLLLLLTTCFLAKSQTKSIFEVNGYEMTFSVEEYSKNEDSVILKVILNNENNKSIFILNGFTANWSIKNESVWLQLGDDYRFFVESYYPMNEIPPGKSKEFNVKVKNHFTDSTIIWLRTGFYRSNIFEKKNEYFNKDFNDIKNIDNYTYDSYHFRTPEIKLISMK